MALRLAFMGTPDFAVPVLAELLAQDHEIVCVYTQPPRPKGRGLTEERSAVHRFAKVADLKVRAPLSFKDEAELSYFRSLGLDAAVVVAYGMLIPKAVLEAPRLGCFNLHASLLPRWRGAAPLQRAILAGDKETGVMVMRMVEGLDTGPILMAERVAIGRKNCGALHDELSALGANLMGRALGALERGPVEETPQGIEGVTYAKKITSEEAHIDWTKNAEELDCQVRAFSLIPGAWTMISGERIKVLAAEPVSGKGAPGEILSGLTIACGEGALKLQKVQRAGRGPMDAETFLRGFVLTPGMRLG